MVKKLFSYEGNNLSSLNLNLIYIKKASELREKLYYWKLKRFALFFLKKVIIFKRGSNT